MKHSAASMIFATTVMLSALPTSAQSNQIGIGSIRVLSSGQILMDGVRIDISGVEARLEQDKVNGITTLVNVFGSADINYQPMMTLLETLQRYDRVAIGHVTGKAN